MTLRELLKRKSHKNIFNVIYKYYLTEHTEDEVIQLSIKFEKALSELKATPIGKKSKDSIYLIEINAEDKSEDFIDICLHDFKKDELFGLDFLDWIEFIEHEVNAPSRLNQTQIVAHILWEITFWGFSREEIRNNLASLKKDLDSKEDFEEIKDFKKFIEDLNLKNE